MILYQKDDKLILDTDLKIEGNTLEIGKEETAYVKIGTKVVDGKAAPVLTKITVAGMKTEYNENDTLDLTGVTVTAYYNDETSKPVTGYTTTPTAGTALTTANTQVVFSYTDGDVTKTRTKSITVKAAESPEE